eukprot:Nitzschia sp. Nitz4//scaffold256_size27904//19844//23755//NITZ4_008172-RA/size27904-augustus-gene-0.6-mRNA-1//-1//CDS//3329544420//3234//frame0
MMLSLPQQPQCRLCHLLVFHYLVLLQLASLCTLTMAESPLLWNTESNVALNDLLGERMLEDSNGPYCQIPLEFNETLGHKELYTIGVLAIRGEAAAFAEFNSTFNEYLSETAGKRFDPPIRFQLKALDFITLFSDVEQRNVDFIYVNPSAYSCIESEYEALSLVSQVSRRVVGGVTYDLKKFGGVIATLADRDDIQELADLRDKIIAAASISGLGSGQMQFKRMVDKGMNYLQDPKQLVFTSNQGLVVKGLINGDFDVGFIRTDQLERSKNADGTPVDLSQFKVIEPIPDLAIDGVPFPFQSSTALYAEWNVAALTHVNNDVSRAVQTALIDIAAYARIGAALQACYASNVTTYEECDSFELTDLYDGPVSCSASHEVALQAYAARSDGKYAGWTPSQSYMQLRSMQEATGFIEKDSDSNIWRCIRSTELYDGITCPAGSHKKSLEEVNTGCEEAGLECLEGFQCVCRPCEVPPEDMCRDSRILIRGKCVNLAVLLSIVFISMVLVVYVVVHFYLQHKRRQLDAVWLVDPSKLEFDNPPIAIGKGTFGLVLLADYRGTRVAVKRVLPPSADRTSSPFDASNFSIRSTSSTKPIGDVENGEALTHLGLSSKKYKKQVEDSRIYASWRGCFNSQNHLKKEFVSEIRHLARLRHPCITTVMGAVMPSWKDEPMLIMEYMSYGSLHDILQDESMELEPEQILAVLQDIAQGLRFLHSATPQVIHGDLKARNVLIDAFFVAKVTDFGLCGKKQNKAVGTPYWMSPELLTGKSINTAASDVYSFGMVVYETYSRRSPYEGEDFEDVIRQVCDPTIRKRPPTPLDCPPRIAKLLTECLNHEAWERPTAEQLDLTLKVELKVKSRTTRLETLNQELEQTNKKIANASAIKLQKYACISNEIRSPLNCIIGTSKILEETELSAMQRDSLSMVVSSGKLLRQIVDDVLDYSNLDRGAAEVVVERANLQEILNGVVHLVKTGSTSTEKRLRIESHFDPELPEFIMTDSRRLQQILYNLLGNAVRFSNDDGLVELSAVIVGSRMLRFSVKDYGKGIPECDFAKIFEPFRQSELRSVGGGIGLGLAISKKLVQAMDGKISVNSEYGNWTQFLVELPFHGERVDLTKLSANLKDTTIFFVIGEKEPSRFHIQALFDSLKVDYVSFSNMAGLARVIATDESLSSDRSYVCLAHEDLCDTGVCDFLTANSWSRLVTFGPNFRVRKSRIHWRSLMDILPSVLLSKLGEFAAEVAADRKKDSLDDTYRKPGSAFWGKADLERRKLSGAQSSADHESK